MNAIQQKYVAFSLLDVVFQLRSSVWLFVTPQMAAHKASLSFTKSWSLLTFMSIESVMPSSYLIPCALPLLPSIFPNIRVFAMSSLFASGGQSIGASASASVHPASIQCLFPWRLTGLISLLSKRLSRIFSNTTVQKHQFFGALPSLQSNSHIHTWPQEKP